MLNTSLRCIMDTLYEPVSLSGPLQMKDFISLYGKRIPLCAAVSKSVFGIGKNDSLTKGQLLDIHCLKETKVLEIEEKSGKKLELPINTSVSCSVVHGESAVGKHETFEGASQLMRADPQPKVVAVQKRAKSSKTLTNGDVLAIKKVYSNQIVCYSFTSKQEIVVSENSQTLFTTDISMLKINLPGLLDHVELPARAVFFSDDIRIQRSMSCVYNVTSARLQKSVLASFHPTNPAAILESIVEIFECAPISLEALESTAKNSKTLLKNGKLVGQNFVPFLLQDSLIDVAATGTALQEKLFSPELTTEGSWRIGVTISVPQATAVNSSSPLKQHLSPNESKHATLCSAPSVSSPTGNEKVAKTEESVEVDNLQLYEPVLPKATSNSDYASLSTQTFEPDNEYVTQAFDVRREIPKSQEQQYVYHEIPKMLQVTNKSNKTERSSKQLNMPVYPPDKSPRHDPVKQIISAKGNKTNVPAQVTQSPEKPPPSPLLKYHPLSVKPAVAKKPQKPGSEKAQQKPGSEKTQACETQSDDVQIVLTKLRSEVDSLKRELSDLKSKHDDLERKVNGSGEYTIFYQPGSEKKPIEEEEHIDSQISDLENITVQGMQMLLDKHNLSQYKKMFEEENIDGYMLCELDEDMLEKDLGVKSKLHRIRLMKLASNKK